MVASGERAVKLPTTYYPSVGENKRQAVSYLDVHYHNRPAIEMSSPGSVPARWGHGRISSHHNEFIVLELLILQ